MADYITAANFKLRHGISVTTNDARIAAHITAASLEVDQICGRRFNADSVATDRYYRPLNNGVVWIDDALEITAVATDPPDTGAYGTAWTVTTEYLTNPTNGIGINGQSGWPATYIYAVGSLMFPTCNRRPAVKVTAKWGWTATPVDVIEATYLITNRLFFETSAPAGVTTGSAEFGVPGSPLQRQYHVEKLLAPYVRADRKLGIAG
jgi:hypothetical protein